MIAALSLSNDSRTIAGILLLTIVAVEFGGVYAGAVALTAGVLALGIGLLTA
jgi:hypothetical protein